MFKKKYLAVAGLMALAVVISGCGKKNSGDSLQYNFLLGNPIFYVVPAV